MGLDRSRGIVVGLGLCAILAVGAEGGCGSGSSKATGSVGGPCYGNGTCNTGLTCLSHLCVQVGAGAAGSNGDLAGAGGKPAGPGLGGAGGGPTTGGEAGAGAGAGGQATAPGGRTGLGGQAASAGGAGASGQLGGGPGTGSAGRGAGGTNAGGAGGSTAGMAGTSGVLGRCGNGALEVGEACDAGARNGVFFGDGSGCSRTCTKEPSCRDAGGLTRACDPVCGDGHKEATEGCDDGNLLPGDGCSATCAVEAGFTCAPQAIPDAQPCSSGAGQCLWLPIVYRDFKNETLPGGHPDFYYVGATDGAGKVKRYCIGNAAGPARGADATARAWDVVQASLVDGKPAFNAARPDGLGYLCQFTDWSTETNGGHVPGYTLAASPLRDTPPGTVTGPSGHPQWKGVVPVFASASSFAEWFADNASNARSTGFLELTAAGNNQFATTGSPNSVTGGFFPLDPPGTGPRQVPGTGEDLLCNLWPYWYPPAFNPPAQPAVCYGSQYLSPPSVDATLYPMGTWADNQQGLFHNFWFTAEIRTTFAFTSSLQLLVYGDDDLYVFLNGKLVVDLGGIHQRLPAQVTVDGASGLASIIEGGALLPSGAINTCPGFDPQTGLQASSPADCRVRTVDLGMTPGRTYELAIFRAERAPSESFFSVTTTGFTRTRSVCTR